MHIQCSRTTIVGYKLVMVSRHVHTFFQEYISEEGVILAILHSIVCYPFIVKKKEDEYRCSRRTTIVKVSRGLGMYMYFFP